MPLVSNRRRQARQSARTATGNRWMHLLALTALAAAGPAVGEPPQLAFAERIDFGAEVLDAMALDDALVFAVGDGVRWQPAAGGGPSAKLPLRGHVQSLARFGDRVWAAGGAAGLHVLRVERQGELRLETTLPIAAHRLVAGPVLAVQGPGATLTLVANPSAAAQKLELGGPVRDLVFWGDELAVAAAGDALYLLRPGPRGYEVALRDRSQRQLSALAVQGELLYGAGPTRRLRSFRRSKGGVELLAEQPLAGPPARLLALGEALVAAVRPPPGAPTRSLPTLTATAQPRVWELTGSFVDEVRALGPDVAVATLGDDGWVELRRAGPGGLSVHRTSPSEAPLAQLIPLPNGALAGVRGGASGGLWVGKAPSTLAAPAGPWRLAQARGDALLLVADDGRVCRWVPGPQPPGPCEPAPPLSSLVRAGSRTWLVANPAEGARMPLAEGFLAVRTPLARGARLSALEADVLVTSDGLSGTARTFLMGAGRPEPAALFVLQSQPAAMVLDGGELFVAEPEVGLQVLDLSQPARPNALSTHAAVGAIAVAANERWVAAALGKRGVTVWSRQGALLRLEGELVARGRARDVALVGTSLWVADSGGVGRVSLDELAKRPTGSSP